jgi:exonuclease VII large subunit
MDERNSAPTMGTTSGAGNNQSGTAGIAGRVREQAAAQLSKQKERATDGLGSVADAVRGTTEQLRNNQHDKVAQFAEQAAQQIDRLSERLRNKDVTELLDDAQQLARRRPAMFVGGAFAIGLLGARFMKSSSTDSSNDDWRRDLPTPYQSGDNTYRSASQNIGGTYGTGTTIGTSGTSSSNAYGNTVGSTAGTTRGNQSGTGTTGSGATQGTRTASGSRTGAGSGTTNPGTENY